MKQFMCEIFTRALLFSGTPAAIRAFLWRDRTAILLYHDPSPATLEAHFEYLKDKVEFVPLSQANSRGSGRPRVAVTFDDGHIGNANLLPVFIKYGVYPTIYICSSVVAHDRTHWFLHPVARDAGVKRLIRMKNHERLAELDARGFRQDLPDPAATISGLSAAHIEEMRPYVDFQSHTRYHPTLTFCDDDECFEELALSKSEVERIVGKPCEHFAYPYGIYGPREVELLKAAGYKTARTTDVGWNDEGSDPFRLKAFDIDDDSSVSWFAAQLTGLTLVPRYLRLGRVRRLAQRIFSRPRALNQA
ncbi:peptidoglycan/xylan/chitin deacetylase (PgdA/CDA1 family) [Paraburkholderia sp. HC6.4b]|uniref:polysaccharide deacetylase family protein n=1 Tax=unclassified Paraburkholderia TaxID=2615204 RepID=UPI001606FD2B|nr:MULTISPECIES: polysaccharide deacetylase family protein [unclassified Paraburkholderia]MBB5407708.1 peptidoglycan/xylan/chitin deacetylase (PgdA/CDA1 family) [Paraburkholderia sp. HC6.4b]MBB5452279.1 peptidoglycan/xylan/chitin deacetylase (PgdA/CDA1 family) [Paraburkholderia sp. Kb1A]